jgi:hypothetical protein
MTAKAASRHKAIGVAPAVAAIAYPFLLQGFHAVVSPPDGILTGIRMAGAAVLLVLAFAMPLSGLAFAWRLAQVPQVPQPSRFDLRARRLAYASIATPPLFVFTGVALGLL